MKWSTCILLFCLLSPLVLLGQKSSETLYKEGLQEAEHQNLENAITLFSKVISGSTSIPDAYLQRGHAYSGLNQYHKAITDYTVYLVNHPKSKEALLSRGVLYYKANELKKAKADLLLFKSLPNESTSAIHFRTTEHESGTDKVFTLQSQNSTLAFEYLGKIESGLQHHTLAQSYFDSALFYQPKNADIHLAKALDWVAQKNFQNAIQENLLAIEAEPDNSLAFNNIASISLELREFKQGEKYLRKSIHLNPELPYPYAQLGYYYLQFQKYHKSILVYDTALFLAPNNQQNYINRGKAYEAIQNWQKAEQDYSKAISLRKTNASSYLPLANLYHKTDQNKEAIALYSLAIYYAPDYGAAYYNRSIAYYKTKQKDKACADVKKAESLGVPIKTSQFKLYCN